MNRYEVRRRVDSFLRNPKAPENQGIVDGLRQLRDAGEFDPRDKEIADLKAKVGLLEAVNRTNEGHWRNLIAACRNLHVLKEEIQVLRAELNHPDAGLVPLDFTRLLGKFYTVCHENNKLRRKWERLRLYNKRIVDPAKRLRPALVKLVQVGLTHDSGSPSFQNAWTEASELLEKTKEMEPCGPS